MEILEINGMFYVILRDEQTGKRIHTDGPYAERWHAESVSRLRELR